VADQAGKNVAICVTGRLGATACEWSIGECAPYNNKNSYPFAMAEKRAKDRVVLKLLGLHGEIYSEDEAEDFKPQQNNAPLVVEEEPIGSDDLISQIQKLATNSELFAWGRKFAHIISALDNEASARVRSAYIKRKEDLTKAEAA
jgi:hypothetical protein